MAAIAGASDGTIERLLTLPRPKAEDTAYVETFAAMDPRIERRYQDNWRYYEQQARFNPLAANPEFIQLGGLPNQSEAEVRRGFAQSVLQQRASTAWNSVVLPMAFPVLAPVILPSARAVRDAKKEVAVFRKQLVDLKEKSVGLTDGSFTLKLHLGYDIATDASKLELVSKHWGAGVYNTNLLGSLVGATIPTNHLSMRFTTTALNFAVAAVQYYPQGKTVESSLSRWLTPHLHAKLAGLYPAAQQNGSQRYSLTFSYLF